MDAPALRAGFVTTLQNQTIGGAGSHGTIKAQRSGILVRLRPNKPGPSLPTSSLTWRACPVNNGGYWSRAAPAQAWALALRYVLPALFASVVATAVSWVFLPDAPTYLIPSFPPASIVLLALLFGPFAGVLSVG